MRIIILPKTPLGRWSVWLLLACVLLFVILVVLGAFTGVADSPLVADIFGPVGLLLGAGSFIVGLLSIIKSKERSILVFLVVIVVFLVLLMEFLEFLWGKG